MSVLKKLKGTFHNAQQDILDGFKALSSIDNRRDQFQSFRSREINLDAGAYILHKFQCNWSVIQSETSESALKAEEVGIIMASVFKTLDRYSELEIHFEQEVKAISKVVATVKQLHVLIDSLQKDFLTAEANLDALEDICEEQDFKNKHLGEQKKLAMYKAKKEAEAERIKVDLAHMHAKKMAVIESAKKVSLQERAEAFMSAFNDDVNYYRTHGYPDLFPSEHTIVSRLSSIELDADNQALDSFLGHDIESNVPGNLELSGEGAYIEDDYIADYSVKEDLDFLDEAEYTSAAVISEMDMQDDMYNYHENQVIDFVYQEDIENPENISSHDVSALLNDPREKEDVCATESTSDNVNDNFQTENIQTPSTDSKSQEEDLDTASCTDTSKAASIESMSITVMEDSGNDGAASSPSI